MSQMEAALMALTIVVLVFAVVMNWYVRDLEDSERECLQGWEDAVNGWGEALEREQELLRLMAMRVPPREDEVDA